ncbi:hypothetical protein RJ640_023954 [Escallonia rubra]|uniref:Protein FAR1-RELATED SEQUENCE n=1 Tax=Escallonia rubra TaxID=112253 RepID=A0AA88RMD3_9ASTE|nr:hypothetical protein RJ640_023954 [Escallonia rubra]
MTENMYLKSFSKVSAFIPTGPTIGSAISMDAHSLPHFQSIEDVDANAYLILGGAMIGIALSKSGEWVVDKFLDSHNHDMNTPSKSGWKSLQEKYNIEENSWLSNMYKIRQHWVKVYSKDTFFAGMTTSGRSESIHSYFDGFVDSSTMLNEFVVQYDEVVKSRRKAEEDDNFMTINSKAVLATKHPIEAKARECYTRNMFEIFKKEWTSSFNCYHETLSKWEDVFIYSAGLVHMQERCIRRTVEYTFRKWKGYMHMWEV